MEVLFILLSFGAAIGVGISHDASNVDLAIVGWFFGLVGGGVTGMIVALRDKRPGP